MIKIFQGVDGIVTSPEPLPEDEDINFETAVSNFTRRSVLVKDIATALAVDADGHVHQTVVFHYATLP